MATNFTQQATRQLDPAFKQQRAAIQSQIPAIQQLYQSLFQGLESQRKTGTQQIFEDASGRGLLNSTIPVDNQAQLGQALLQRRSELGAEQLQRIGEIRERLGGLGISRLQAIQNLANALASRSLANRQFSLQKRLSNREYRLQKRLANRQYQLQKKQLTL